MMPSRTMTTSEWSHPRAGLLMKLRLLPLLLPLLVVAPDDDCIIMSCGPSPVVVGKGGGGGGGGGGTALLAGLLDRLVLGPAAPLECDNQAMMNSPPSTQCRSSTGASLVP